jgi:hypothetical protein
LIIEILQGLIYLYLVISYANIYLKDSILFRIVPNINKINKIKYGRYIFLYISKILDYRVCQDANSQKQVRMASPYFLLKLIFTTYETNSIKTQ